MVRLPIPRQLKRIPYKIWVLGVADGFLNVSATIIFTISGPFMKEILRSNPIAMGTLEGIVELLSWSVRLISGILSDYFKNRKGLMVSGYMIVILSRPLLALATNIHTFLIGRSLDRVGKGIQATPREAFVADISPSDLKGACFGLRHSLGILGSVAGAFIVSYLISVTHCNYRIIFWISSIPALCALLFLILSVHEVKPSTSETLRISLNPRNLLALGKVYWGITVISVFFMFCRCSEVFLTLSAIEMGISAKLVPFIMMTYNLSESVISYPIGRLSDYIGRPWCIGIAITLLMVANFAIGNGASHMELLFLGSLLWGIQRGIGHSIFLSWVADVAPKHLRATAYGVFYLISGLALFLANFMSGLFIDHVGYRGLYMSHAFLGVLPLASLIFLSKRLNLSASH